MQQLVISKIDVNSEGTRYMECTMIDTMDFRDFENHPKVICLFGTHYHKTSWNSDYKVVHYQTRLSGGL